VEYHLDSKNKFKFKDDTSDDEWLAKVGAEGWIVFSHDRKFHKELPAIAAIKQHRIGCFYLWGAQMPIWDKLVCFARGSAMIRKTAAQVKKPFISLVSQR
jgi:hypothetical protein